MISLVSQINSSVQGTDRMILKFPNVSMFLPPAGFMSVMEADARERASRRAGRIKVAEEWKEKGNVEFRQGNMEKALEYYTEVHVQLHILNIFIKNYLLTVKSLIKNSSNLCSSELVPW